jgi:hypothetical protein
MSMTELETPRKRSFVWPAEYYSSATPPAVLPQWAPFGCGIASVIILIVVFAGGAFLASGGFLDLMDFAIGMSVSEMKGQYAPDVSATRKTSLEAEVKRMQKNMREEAISIVTMQPFLEKLREAGSDKKVTEKEAAELEAIAKKVNANAKPKRKLKASS